MPALDPTLVAAIRAGGVARHVFVELDHSQGVVRAWDGIGEFVFGGQTYLGVAGLATVQGVSASADVQNHEVRIELNGVPRAAMRETDPSIRGRVCTIRLVWISGDGLVIGSRVVFIGKGSNLVSKIDGETLSLVAIIRGAMADWSTIPRAYYTDAEQQRRFAGDTGFKLMPQLENSVVTGWGKVAESSGENAARGTGFSFIANLTTTPIIADVHLNSFISTGFGTSLDLVMRSRSQNINTGAAYAVTEESTGAVVSVQTSAAGELMRTTSGVCYIDLNGFVRTPGGSRVMASGQPLRKLKPITSDGTAIAGSTVTSNNVSTAGGNVGTFATVAILSASTLTIPATAGPGAAFALVFNETGGTYATTLGALSEVGTGNAVSFVIGIMQCNGQPCRISTTGVVLTNTGRRVKQGASDNNFLRVPL